MGSFEIVYRPSAVKDIAAIPLKRQQRIKDTIECKLTTNPTLYGVPLHGNLKAFYKLRVGDYRVVFTVSNHIVRIFCIGLRKDIYKKTERREGSADK